MLYRSPTHGFLFAAYDVFHPAQHQIYVETLSIPSELDLG